MKPKTVILLAVAVGSGLLAMIGVQQAMSGTQSQPEEMVSVAVALADIGIGDQLSEENVGFKEMPKTALVGYNDPVLSVEQYDKRAAQYALRTGDIVRMSKLTEPGGGGKSLQIPPGMRVLTINVDDTASMAGLLRPGDRVDVMVTYANRDNKGRQNTKTTTLLEYVEVFATDATTAREANAGADDGKKSTRTVGLLLAPNNVPYVKLAESKGKLALSWRRRDDDELASVGPINEELLDELRGLDAGSGRPGYDQFAQPLYGDDPELATHQPAASNDFGGIGSQNAGHPTTAPAPSPAPAQGGNMDSFLSAAEAAPPVAIPVVPTKPAKPTWKLQIYNGNQSVEEEFELPEPEVTESEIKELQETAGGNALWSLLKQAL
ncbi:MAG: Flp pilus assembly protein CpaB [Planctomycetaceae bacterium]